LWVKASFRGRLLPRFQTGRSPLPLVDITTASNFFAHQLAIDDEDRREGGSEQLFQSVAQQLSAAGDEYTTISGGRSAEDRLDNFRG
jgi:hypothetical protein